jgi:hypothetical protein
MENLWYSGLKDLLKEGGLAGRLGDRGGDKGPGSDEPFRRQREIDWDRVFRLMFDVLRRPEPPSSPPSFGPGPILLAELPPIGLEPMPPPPPPSLERRDREKLLKKLERSIAEEFRQRVSEGQGPVADVDIRKLLGRRPPPQTLRFERQAPPRPEKEPFSQMLTRFMQEEPAREETFTQKLERHLQEPEPGEETFTEKLDRHLQELPDFRTEGERRKVLELVEKGKIPENVPLGEGASFEQDSLKLPTDEFVAEAVVEANRILQAPGNTASFEGGKYIIQDANGNVLAEGTVVLSSSFYTRNSAGEYSVINPPIAAGVGFELKINPPADEKLTVYRGLGRHRSIGAIYGSDSDGQQSVGISINIGFSLPLGIPYVVSTPIDPKEILKTLPEEFTPGA